MSQLHPHSLKPSLFASTPSSLPLQSNLKQKHPLSELKDCTADQTPLPQQCGPTDNNKVYLLSALLSQYQLRHLIFTFDSLKTHRPTPAHISGQYKSAQTANSQPILKTSANSSPESQLTTPAISSLPLQSNTSSSHSCSKFLQRQLFLSQLRESNLQKQINFLNEQLEESQRRLQKETAKKRQSLQGLAQELSQKSELVEQLKSALRSMEMRMGKVPSMLQEDAESMRRNLQQMEAINDQINHTLAHTRSEKKMVEQEWAGLKVANGELKEENRRLRERLFQLEQKEGQLAAARKEAELVSKKCSGKLQRLVRREKKLGELSKCLERESLSCQALSALSAYSSPKLSEIEDSLANDPKLQALFTFLFHIDDPTFQLQQPHRFDQEETQLLLAHRQKYQTAFHYQPQNQQNISQTIQHFGQSLLNALQVPPKEEKRGQKDELIDRLVEKISELKEKQLHLRSVILSLLKTLELRSLKKEAEAILALLCDIFEYSQAERSAVMPPKSRKFFGLL